MSAGKVLGYRNLSELRRRLQPVILRRDRALVRDQLPDRIEQRRDVVMSPRQVEIHDEASATAARLARILKRRPLTPVGRPAESAHGLQRRRAGRQDHTGITQARRAGQHSRRDLPTGGAQGRSLLPVGPHGRAGRTPGPAYGPRLYAAARRRAQHQAWRPDGARFRDDEACQVFISTDTGGTALNLQSASVLVNLDLPWNPEVLDQRVARVHRLGQRSKVQVLHLVAPDSYEEQVLGLIRGKCNLFDNVLTRMPARTW